MSKSPIQRLLSGRSRTPHRFRLAGDRARDVQDWPRAQQAYEEHLRDAAGDGAVWVQLGHARKEQGDLDGASAAYERAAVLMPGDADLLLQIGHLRKLQGREADAISSYAESLRFSPSPSAHLELVNLREARQANRILSETANADCRLIYLEIKDLLMWLHDHMHVSGIQRVHLAIIHFAIEAERQQAGAPYRFVFSDNRGDGLHLLNTKHVAAIAAYLANPRIDRLRLTQMLKAAMSAATPVQPGKNDTYMIAGAFWVEHKPLDLLRSLQARGLRTGIFFHDLFPLNYPELCDDELVEAFSENAVEALSYIDFGLTNSEHTKAEIVSFLSANDMRRMPLETVPLAHGIGDSSEPATPSWPDTLAFLRGQPFVMSVSTIEARKNHRYLFDLWKKMIGDGFEMPTLLLVGRRGWRVDDLFAQLEATDYLDGKVRLLHDLSDGEIEHLYRNCLFTAFPSLVEGWGLPIGESLRHGKLCVAGNTASMPEVGGEFVEYIDPLNLRSGLEVVERLLTDPSAIPRWEAKIAAGFRPREWSQVAAELLEATARLSREAPRPARPPFLPLLRAGDPAHLGGPRRRRRKIGGDGRERLKDLIPHEYWSRPDEQAVWILDGEGWISFRTDVGPGREISLCLLLCAQVEAQAVSVSLTPSGGPTVVETLETGRDKALRLRLRTDEEGAVRVRIRSARPALRSEASALHKGVGLVSLGYASSGDEAGWSDLLAGLLSLETPPARA